MAPRMEGKRDSYRSPAVDAGCMGGMLSAIVTESVNHAIWGNRG